MSTSNTFATIKNQGTISLRDLPVLPYGEFFRIVSELLGKPGNHCVNYYAYRNGGALKFICCIAEDSSHNIIVLSHEMQGESKMLPAISKEHYSFHIYEREISENFGIEFMYHHPPITPICMFNSL